MIRYIDMITAACVCISVVVFVVYTMRHPEWGVKSKGKYINTDEYGNEEEEL
jgi:ABC-type transport system involved in Fe-S cluster assembly fused permease/ATPase subunit